MGDYFRGISWKPAYWHQLSIPEDKVTVFPQLFAKVGGSSMVLQSPLLGVRWRSIARWEALGHVHGILPVDQWIQLDRHFSYLEKQPSLSQFVYMQRLQITYKKETITERTGMKINLERLELAIYHSEHDVWYLVSVLWFCHMVRQSKVCTILLTKKHN